MQAILEQQRSNAIVPMSSDSGGSTQAPPIVVALIMALKDLTSSVNSLTGAMYGQTKVIGSPAVKKIPDNNVIDVVPNKVKPANKVIDVVPNKVKPANKEAELEYSRLLSKQMELLERIEENTRPKEIKAQKTEEQGGIGLGGLATTIAVVAGTIAGLVTAWAKTIKFFVVNIGLGIEKMVVFLSRWFPSLRKILFNIEVTVSLLVDSMKGIFNNVITKIGSIFTGAINFFKGIFGEGSMIGKVITTIKTAVTGFLEPIIAGFKTISQVSGPIGKAVAAIKGALGGMMEFFGMIGSKLSSFGTLFGAVSKIVSKIAYPLMIIMSVWDTVKGALAGWEEGGFVGAIGGAIKGLFNGLVFGVLDMIKGAISWIAGALGFTAVEEFLDSFSFEDMFSSFVDAVLFIPKKIQEFIMSPIETLKSLGESIMSLFEPIKAVMSTLVDALLFIPRTLFGLINDYIVTPLTEVFKPVTNFFKGIANKVMGFFEDFGIPEMGFSVLGKKFSIGPYYPFRPDEGTVRVASNEELKTTSASTTDSSGKTTSTDQRTYKQNIVSSGSMTIDEEAMRANGMSESQIAAAKAREKDKTMVLSTTERSVMKDGKDGSTQYGRDLATFDPKTGKAMLSGDSVLAQREGTLAAGDQTREISTRAFRQIKANAQAGGDQSKIAEIVKEDDAYQKLGFFDKRKVDVGYAKASDLLAAAKPTSADTLTKKSGDNAALKQTAVAPTQNTNVVNAPVNNTTNQTQLIKSPVRNQESSQSKYLDSRYAF